MLSKRAANLKMKMKSGGLSSGMWVGLPSPSICEIIADSGIDWIVVDAEHSPFSPETQQHMLMAFKGSDTVPILRVPWNDEIMIKQALDLGWDGVLIPQVNTADEVRQAVSACRYPPVGNRGFGPRRAANYGRQEPEYRETAEESVICMIQVEKVQAVDEIDEMVKVDGFDWLFVGRADMSGSIGRLGDTECDEIWDAVKRIFKAAKDAGIPYGNALVGADSVQKQVDLGSSLIQVGEDVGLFRTALGSAVKAFQDVAES